MLTEIEQKHRFSLYQFFIKEGRAPNIKEAVDLLDLGKEETVKSLERLAEEHALVLTPNTHEIWMMHPFSGIATKHIVETNETRYWANCGWDLLGVPVVVGTDAIATAEFLDGSGVIRLKIEGGELVEGEGVVHFAIPANRFWDDVGYT